MTTAPVLTVDDLHVHYGGSHILQGVSFEVPARGVTALLGRNGVGKTTTLKGILGLAPRQGRIALQGKDIQRGKTFQLVRGGIGYVPEDREVFGGLTVDENLRLVDEPTKGLAPKLVTEVADVLARVAETTPILLVEQNLPLVRRIADTVVVLDAGRVVHRGDATALLADADLTRELLGVSLRRPREGSG